ncbi:MAG TPA: hypothetical protein DD490_07660 [Acidobacteria bacterium]|nr:hypothetical protein [Acidobacteriota bacterium]
MGGDPWRRAAWPAGEPAFAFACFVLWGAAALSAGWVGAWLGLGGAAIGLGLAVFLRDPAGTWALLRPGLRPALLGAAAGGAMAGATYLVYPVLVRLLPFLAGDAARLYEVIRTPAQPVAVLVLVPVILGEELVWRGAVQSACARRLGPAGGVALAAGAYAAVLVPLGSPALVLAALLCGLCWGTLRATTGSLVPPLVAHLVWDVLVLLWLPLDAG